MHRDKTVKRSTKIILGALVGLSLVGAVAAKQFQHGGFGPGCSSGFNSDHRGGWLAKRIAWKLDLNEQQISSLDDLKLSVFESMDMMRTERLTSEQLKSVLNNELDQTKAMQLLEQRLQSVKQNAPELISAFAAFYDKLDSTQQAELSDMIEYRMGDRNRYWDHYKMDREQSDPG